MAAISLPLPPWHPIRDPTRRAWRLRHTWWGMLSARVARALEDRAGSPPSPPSPPDASKQGKFAGGLRRGSPPSPPEALRRRTTVLRSLRPDLLSAVDAAAGSAAPTPRRRPPLRPSRPRRPGPSRRSPPRCSPAPTRASRTASAPRRSSSRLSPRTPPCAPPSRPSSRISRAGRPPYARCRRSSPAPRWQVSSPTGTATAGDGASVTVATYPPRGEGGLALAGRRAQDGGAP